MRRIALCAALLLVSGLMSSGCPIEFFEPPFDATGSYEGTWNVGLKQGDCALRMDLAQDVESGLIENARVSGAVEVDFTCFADFFDLLVENEIIEGQRTFDVEGFLLPEGTLELNTPEFAADCDDTVCVSLIFVGTGEDVDSDGSMDDYAGGWLALITFGQLPPEIQAIVDTYLADLGLGDISEIPLPAGGDFAVSSVD